MTECLIALYHPPGIPESTLPEVAKAAAALVQEARAASVWVFGGGLVDPSAAAVVAPDRAVTDGPFPESKELLGGVSVVDIPTREAPLEWAAKLADACRCAQEVREVQSDPTNEEK